MENNGIEQEVAVKKKRFKAKTRPMPERMCQHLTHMARGCTKTDFLNTLSANLVIFCLTARYKKEDLKDRIDSLYTFFEKQAHEQSC